MQNPKHIIQSTCICTASLQGMNEGVQLWTMDDSHNNKAADALIPR